MDSKRERYNKYKRVYAAAHPYTCDRCGVTLRRGTKNRHLKLKRHSERPEASTKDRLEPWELSYCELSEHVSNVPSEYGCNRGAWMYRD